MTVINRYFSGPLDWRWIIPLSAVYLVLFGALETLVGLAPGTVHLDEHTYLFEQVGGACEDGVEPFRFFGEGYFCVVYLAERSLYALVLVNTIVYLFTSFLLISIYNRYEMKPISRFLLFLILFDPFRAHMAVHVLKESFVYLSVVLMFYSRVGIALGLISNTFFRLAGPLYALLLIKKIDRYMILVGILLFSFVLYKYPHHLMHLLNGGNADMIFKDYDKVPTFNEYGLFGDILRALLWPILFLTGLFFITSPAALFAPIALMAILIQIWGFVTFRRPVISIGALGVLSVFALMVPGFTSYARYAYPVLIVMPVIVLGINNNPHRSARLN